MDPTFEKTKQNAKESIAKPVPSKPKVTPLNNNTRSKLSTVVSSKVKTMKATTSALLKKRKTPSVTFASSDNLYHMETLWSDEAKKNGKEVDRAPELVSDTTSTTYSISDDCSISSDKSLAAVLNVEPKDYKIKPDYNPTIVGHRGVVYCEPENTISSFQTAAAVGCHAVELDVFLLKCNTVIVFHGDGNDENPGGLKSHCGVEGSILDYTLEDVRKLSFVEGDAHFCPNQKLAMATIPTLEEVLEVAKELGFDVKIELKGPGTEEPVLEIVERMGMVDQCTFSSFHHERIERIRELHPQKHADGSYVYKTGALFTECPEDFIARAKKVEASEVHLCYDTCTRERVKAIHEEGMGSLAWFCGPMTMKKHCDEKYLDVGNEDASMYQMVMHSGVEALCVNRPELLLNVVSNK